MPWSVKVSTAQRRADQQGVAALMVALTMAALMIASAFVLTLGLVRIDRQVDKSAADAAVLAGLSGLNGNDGLAHPFAGVCKALQYMQQNDRRFANTSHDTGTWTDGTGTTTKPDGCDTSTTPTIQQRTCTAGDATTWARYTWTGAFQGTPLEVVIQSGYELSSSSGWHEDALPAAVADESDSVQGCDQLAVMVTEGRSPGLGILARGSDISTSIRSVGRVTLGPGGYAPAMLLLKRTGCPSLQVGSTAGSSWVKVYGSVTQSGVSQPGTIHADSDGQGCSGAVYYGKATDGIIAYAAPLSYAHQDQADPARPGQITSVAQQNGTTSYDSLSKVYGSSQVSGSGGATAPTGRTLVTRKPVDDRYLTAARTAIAGAQSTVFGASPALTPGNAETTYGYKTATCNANGTVSLSSPVGAGDSLYVDCPTVKSAPTLLAQTVVFNGTVAPGQGNTISLPNATHVYIFGGGGHALDLTGNGSAFEMHNTAPYLDTSSGTCSNDTTSGKATLFIDSGDLNESNGGTLQMCNTTVFMMGGQPDGCLPAPYADIASAPAPSQTVCGGGLGNGQIKQTGGNVDWTAPNELADTLDSNGDPTDDALAGWADPDGPEDLALWDESAGTTNNSNAYTMAGGGTFHLQGIFMVPNAEPFSLTGNSNLDLKNAEFVASTIQLASNNTTLSMTVDPNAAITLPRMKSIGLVR